MKKDLFWKKLVAAYASKYGISALTTYESARMHGVTAENAFKLMKAQVAELGVNYPGGFECTKYRGKERIARFLATAPAFLDIDASTVMTARNFISTMYKNADGTPARARRNGKTKTWKTRPGEFRIPVKRGLRDCFYITHENAHLFKVVP